MLTADIKKRDQIVSVCREGNVLSMITERGRLRLEPKRADIIRIRYTRRVDYVDETGIGISQDPDYSEWNYEEKQGEICLVTDSVVLKISKSDSAIRYYDKDGK